MRSSSLESSREKTKIQSSTFNVKNDDMIINDNYNPSLNPYTPVKSHSHVQNELFFAKNSERMKRRRSTREQTHAVTSILGLEPVQNIYYPTGTENGSLGGSSMRSN